LSADLHNLVRSHCQRLSGVLTGALISSECEFDACACACVLTATWRPSSAVSNATFLRQFSRIAALRCTLILVDAHVRHDDGVCTGTMCVSTARCAKLCCPCAPTHSPGIRFVHVSRVCASRACVHAQMEAFHFALANEGQQSATQRAADTRCCR
jgi:hypothetical protein